MQLKQLLQNQVKMQQLKLLYKNINFKYIIIGACDSTISKINELGLNDDCILNAGVIPAN